MSRTAIVIVTHNSEQVIRHCIDAIDEQSVLPQQVVIVDSGSHNCDYLEEMETYDVVSCVIREGNIGFSRANNVGISHIKDDSKYILFLNPDTMLDKESLRLSEKYMDNDPTAGAITGVLQGYDFKRSEATGLLDTTGIFRKWYGRWYDRGNGEDDRGQYQSVEDIPAACGAFLFCRTKALNQASLTARTIFDEDFFLYKEDIELCFRLRKSGWKVRYVPEVIAFHGRGWQGDRKTMSRALRKTAAHSEILLYKKHPSPYMLWALLKYFFVTTFDV